MVVLLLAERARLEGTRSTRALEDRPGCPLKRQGIELGGEGRSLIIYGVHATRGLSTKKVKVEALVERRRTRLEGYSAFNSDLSLGLPMGCA